MKSALLLGVQLLAIGYLLLTGHWIAAPTWVWLELLGAALLVWAIWTVKPQHVNPLPDVRRNAQLVTRGPYRFIRHPMYTGVLLGMLALVLDHCSPARLVGWFLLLADLLAKLRYEEALLTRRFPEYATYQCRTKRLLPFLY